MIVFAIGVLVGFTAALSIGFANFMLKAYRTNSYPFSDGGPIHNLPFGNRSGLVPRNSFNNPSGGLCSGSSSFRSNPE